MATASVPATSTSPELGATHATLDKALGVLSALAVALGGLLHLQVWNSDYRDLPDGRIPGLWVVKTGFPLNAAASLLVAAALVAVAFGALAVLRRVAVPVALAIQVGSIGALVASRRGNGIFDWTEKGYDGDVKQILVVEVVAVVLLLATAVVPGLVRARSASTS